MLTVMAAIRMAVGRIEFASRVGEADARHWPESCRAKRVTRSGPPPLVWLSRSLRGSCCQEHALAEQVEAGATVHLPLDQLEPSDLALGLAAAPGRRERRPDCSTVLLPPSRKGLESADPRPPGVGQPGVQRHARRLRAD